MKTTSQCILLIQKFNDNPSSEKTREKEDVEDKDDFLEVNATLMIFADVESKSRLKVINREVNMAVLTTPS